MSQMLREWVIGLMGAALVSAAATALAPEGRTRRIVQLVCGLAVIVALLAPVKELDLESLAAFSEKYGEEGRAAAARAADTEEMLLRRIIEQRTEAYILDKGHALGIEDLAVQVTAEKTEEGAWIPKRARLNTRADAFLRQKLQAAIEAELGIAAEELNWSVNDENEG